MNVRFLFWLLSAAPSGLVMLYGEAYTLSIDETEGRYDVLLSIPSQPELKLQ